MHYYTWNIGDYSSHASHLDIVEDCAFRRLLDRYYLSEEPIPSDVTVACRLIGMREHQKEVEIVLREFFTQTESGWVNKRAEQEIAHYKGKIDQASRAGKASAERRLNAGSTPVQRTRNQPITNNQEPITNNHKKEERGAPSAAAVPRGTRLPLDFVLSESWGEWALQEQKTWSPEHCRMVGEKFKDHWRAAPGSRGVKLDWQATWRNWVRNEGAMRADQKPKLTLMEVMDREDQNAA